jgi:hypothetical protein
LSGKRWQWFAVIDNAFAVGGTVVDDAPVGTALLRVADRAGELLVDADLTFPPRLSPTRRRRRTLSPGSTYRGDVCGSWGRAVSWRWRRVSRRRVPLAASTAEQDAVSAVSSISVWDGGENVTQKETCVPVESPEARSAFEWFERR